MNDWSQILVKSEDSIIKVLEIIDKSSMQIALVVDDMNRLIGTVTDGDVRRGILKRVNLEGPVSQVMNRDFSYTRLGDGREKALAIMTNKSLHQLPVIDATGCIVGLQIIDALVAEETQDNIVLLMAGGLGSRLQSLTVNCPKPLLNVGGKPILESIIESFIEQGFKRFYISINYMGEMIEEYFGDGSDLGIEINYIREDKRLGTAGALRLLPAVSQPIIVMNGDILTKVDFRNLLDFHNAQKVDATICLREYQLQIPYGVVRMKNDRLMTIEEKPKEKFYISAGLYVLNPDTIKHIPHDTYFDMPQLFNKLSDMRCDTAVYQINEYWIDIGQKDDYERANGEYWDIFKKDD